MAKKKEKNDSTPVADAIEVVKLASIEKLEEVTKVGFFCERKQFPDILEMQYRLACESKDGDSDPDYLTPFMTAQTLQTMIDGCLFLYPLLMKIIKDRQSNAEDPEKVS